MEADPGPQEVTLQGGPLGEAASPRISSLLLPRPSNHLKLAGVPGPEQMPGPEQASMRWVEVDDKYTLSSRKFTRNPGEDGSDEHTRVSIPASCTPTSAPTPRSGRDVCAVFSVMLPYFLQKLTFSWKVELNQPILDPTRKTSYTVPR